MASSPLGAVNWKRGKENRHKSSVALRLTFRVFVGILEIMKITNVRHKGLRRFIENDDAAGLPTQYIRKIRNIIAFLQEMDSEEEVRSIPTWKAHQLTGHRKGTWSLFVSRNWRITFAINNDGIEIIDLDFEDYH